MSLATSPALASEAVAPSPPSTNRAPWIRFAVRRIITMIVALWAIATITFLLVRIGGQDPVRAISGTSATPEFVAQKRAELGLDGPVVQQYADYLGRLVRFDFGTSFVTDESVLHAVQFRAPYTFGLGLLGFLLALAISLPAGMAIAAGTRGNRRRALDTSFNWVTGLLTSVPGFVAAIGLVLLFSVTLDWLPPAGHDGFQAWILPVISVALAPAAMLSRLVAAETSRVLNEDYMRTARANRLPATTLYLRHALPNVATVVMTYGGLTLAGLLSGAVITETIFAWPGLGSALSNAVLGFDYPMTQTIVLVLAAVVLLINALVECALALIDPRSMVTEV